MSVTKILQAYFSGCSPLLYTAKIIRCNNQTDRFSNNSGNPFYYTSTYPNILHTIRFLFEFFVRIIHFDSKIIKITYFFNC
jgi:hypothetical protein